MNRGRIGMMSGWCMVLLSAVAQGQIGGGYDLTWNSLDGGGETFSTGGGYELGGTIGQPDGGAAMTGGGFELSGGFWPGADSASTGIRAATITMAVSRKPNPGDASGFCDLPLLPEVQSEARLGGITELRIAFDVPPGGPGANPVTIEEATCAAPDYVPYTGTSVMSAFVEGHELVPSFTPGLANGKTYRFLLNGDLTAIGGQAIEVGGLVGDVDSSGRTNATDRSFVVSAWTDPANFSCVSDVDSSGRTNATDRSLVVAAWTGVDSNCAP